MKVAICGGHLTPALAVINELKKRKISEIIYLGRKHAMEGDKTPSAESVVIPTLNVKFYPIPVGRLQRRFTRYTIPSLLRIPIGLFYSLLILGQEKPDLIISFGSYVAVPVVTAGWILGIPSITHEQTVKGGLANRIISKFAKKIAISWPDSAKFFPKQKIILTGNPIREELLSLTKKRTSRPVIFITGGNQGAHSINEMVLEIIDDLLKRYEVIHQTGGAQKYKDYEMLNAKVSQLPRKLQRRYFSAKWLNSLELAEVYAKATLLVGRSGANTVSEVAALGLPSIFIPLPWAGGGEQLRNAEMLSNLGSALVFPQERLTPKRLLAAINNMVENIDKYKSAARKAKKLVRSDSAKLLVDEALNLVSQNEER